MPGTKHRTEGTVHSLLTECRYGLAPDKTMQGHGDIFYFHEIQNVCITAGCGRKGYSGNSEIITQTLCSDNLSLKNLSESSSLRCPGYFPGNSISGF